MECNIMQVASIAVVRERARHRDEHAGLTERTEIAVSRTSLRYQRHARLAEGYVAHRYWLTMESLPQWAQIT